MSVLCAKSCVSLSTSFLEVRVMRAKNCVSLMVAVALGLSVLGPGLAFGDLIASDSFNYATGDLAGNNGGTDWNEAWEGSHGSTPLVVSPGLTYPGVVSAGNATQQTSGYISGRIIQNWVSSGSLWVSFLAEGVNGTTGWGGVSLLGYDGSSTFEIEQISAYTGDWSLYHVIPDGIHSSVATDATTHLITMNVRFGAGSGGNDQVLAWIDPSTSGVPSDASAFANVEATHNRVAGVDVASSIGITIDEIRLATTFAESIGQPIPEPSALVLVATGLIGLLAYAWRKRK